MFKNIAKLMGISLMLSFSAFASAQTPNELFTKPCIQVDPDFPYYQNRSWDSVAEEVAINGFQQVAITGTSPKVLIPELITALKKKGLTVRCLYGPMNGYYVSQSKNLPEGWEKWRVTYAGTDPFLDIAFFCPNEPASLEWRKKEVTDALLAHPEIDIFDVGEIFYFGNLEPNLNYACVCQRCVDKFTNAYPEEKNIPDFVNTKSIYYYKTNKELYKKWVEFRVDAAVKYQNDIINGKGGIRELCPNVKICTWNLGCSTPQPDPVAAMREAEASDGAAIVKMCHPDSHCIQTNAPDWTKVDLLPTYPKEYLPFLNAIKAVSPKLQVSMQTEIGSMFDMRRSRDWYKEFDKTAHEIGFTQTMGYMYCLFKDIAVEKPALMKARLESDDRTITLIFNKRLDAKKCQDKALYSIPGIQVEDIKVDGNLVVIKTKGASLGRSMFVEKAYDDPTTRHFAAQLKVQNEAGPFKVMLLR